MVRSTPSPVMRPPLASRARRRVRGAATVPKVELVRQRHVVDAFLAAARSDDFNALVALLDPDIVLRAERSPSGVPIEIRGASTLAKQALAYSHNARFAQPALVNGWSGPLSPFTDACPLCSTSKSGMRGSLSSKCLPTRRVCASSTWRSSASDHDDRPCKSGSAGSPS